MHPKIMHRREKSSSTMIQEEEGGGDVSFPQRRRTPSFSSSLLDAITRSLDLDHPPNNNNNNVDSNFTHTPKHTNFTRNNHGNRERMNLRRSLMMEDWMEKQSTKSSASHFTKSSSSSSECSSGEPFSNFSSSETDTTTTTTTTTTTHNSNKKKKQRSRPKSETPQKPEQRDCGFAKTTKLRALKIYGELNQRVKQPISPGSRIAAFLSSIFNSQNVKKAKMCYVGAAEDVRFEQQKSKSPCFSSSSVSSFTMRSCMTKTPSSSSSTTKGKNSNNGVKRCVRFYPVSVILGEDSPPRDPALFSMPSFQKVSRSSSSTKELKNKVVAAKENSKLDFREFYGGNGGELDEDEEEEDEDALSCSSSDLFELDHLINGGGGRYQQELPVYETTNLETNKAIANGLRL